MRRGHLPGKIPLFLAQETFAQRKSRNPFNRMDATRNHGDVLGYRTKLAYLQVNDIPPEFLDIQIIDAVSIITYGDHSLSDQPAYPVFTLILQQFVQPSGEPSFHEVKSSLIKKSVLSDFQANSPEQKNCLYSPDSYLRSEIVVHDVLSRYAQLIEHLVDRRIHHRRPAKIVFDIFGRFMVFEVVFKYDFVDKAHIAAPIVLFLRVGKRDMEMEVRELSSKSDS